MSIILIHAIGFTACSCVAIIGLKSLYAASQIVTDPNDYPENIPLEERNVLADVVGLGVEMVGYGIDTIEGAAENAFNSRPASWAYGFLTPLQIVPDGKLLKYKNDDPNEWAGYGDEPPKTKPGKFEMEL